MLRHHHANTSILIRGMQVGLAQRYTRTLENL